MQRVIKLKSWSHGIFVSNPITKRDLAPRDLRVDTYNNLRTKFGITDTYLISTEPLRKNGRSLGIFKIEHIPDNSYVVSLNSPTHGNYKFCKRGFRDMMRTTTGKIYLYKVNEQ
jgi:hypothetical protein